MSESKSSRTASIAAGLGIAGPVATIVGIIAAQSGAPALTGFGLFQLGILCGLLALILGAVGIFLTRGGVGGRSRAFIGVGLGVAMIAIVVIGASPGAGVPAINDITTNLDDPPEFAPAPEDHHNATRNMSYPADWKPLVRAAYPDLEPIRTSITPGQAYATALGAAEQLDWTVTHRNRDHFTFEAEDETALFRFVDDIVVRVTDDGSGQAVVDIRSKSRDGRGDVGANAARIRLFTADLNLLIADGVGAQN
jgi:uncharacterized protein (DUF1499 family)